MVGQLRRPAPNDGSDLSVLKEIPKILKESTTQVTTSVDGFSDHFWNKGNETLKPVPVAFVCGLIVGALIALLVANLRKNS